MIPSKVKIAQPGWLERALRDAPKSFELLTSGKVPEVLLGWMVVVTCRRLLRCVYGSDERALEALMVWNKDEKDLLKKFEQPLN